MESEQFVGDQIDIEKIGKIFAGEVHYCRIPYQYWEHRIQMIKAMGLNTLSVYIMWNFHELQKGKFDYQTEEKNLPLFLELAEKHNMMVLFRPGPYVCAEWDFGGLPGRLLSVPDLVIRSCNKPFLDQTRIYFESLLPIMKAHIRSPQNPKGCIVMLQIQNQYGFYGKQKNYMTEIRKIWKDFGICLPEYYVDWERNIHKCHWEGAHIGVNNLNDKGKAKTARKLSKNGIILGGEIYSGWMTHWNSKWGGKSIDKCMDDYQFLLKEGYSFAMYMVHGGTNFGLTAGANGPLLRIPLVNRRDYWGAVTSYDYDAPINQQGRPTDKFYSLKSMIATKALWEVPKQPEPIAMIEVSPIKIQKKASLLMNLGDPIIDKSPLCFETSELKMFNQGIVVYETQLQKEKDYSLELVVHDFGVVFLGDKFIQAIDRSDKRQHKLKIKEKDIQKFGKTLRIIVEAMGHINFSEFMLKDKKGIIQFSESKSISGWKMYRVPIDQQILSWSKTKDSVYQFPDLYEGKFELKDLGDTYLDVNNYGKGYIWVNGHNLGRYWNVGPQKRLFCPGVWLREGENTINVLNIWGEAGDDIQGYKQLDDNYEENKSKCPIM